MQWRNKTLYPYSAIVGQDKMKLSLILNVINPKIGGVLLRGEKGTGKSLAVRALANLLPDVEVVADCPFHCDPYNLKELCSTCSAKNSANKPLSVVKPAVSVVDLPVGVTEDRLVGTLDIEKAIKSGEKHFEPGILAAANRNILYIDEVNLLDDHIVDVLLDAAAMGVNFVEREGVSFTHPSQFILIGTMNPEEGELRPQLLDRFALSVDVKGIPYREARAEIIRRRIAFESDPVGFLAAYQESQENLRSKIVAAAKILPKVKLNDSMLDLITQIFTDFCLDGHRAYITIYKTACTLAAFKGRLEVTEEDIKEASELALPHRTRRQPFEETKMEQQKIEDSLQKWSQNHNSQKNENQSQATQDLLDNSSSSSNSPDIQNLPQNDGEAPEQISGSASPYAVKPFSTPVLDSIERNSSGRRSKSISDSRTGRYVNSIIPKGKVSDLAFDATLRAAAPFQQQRKTRSGKQSGMIIEKVDFREKVRERKVGNLIMFVVDASGSMAAEERMVATKGAVLSLLIDAYQRRDRVGMIVFRRNTAEVVLPPTNSVELAQKYLSTLPTGGRTPLAHGLSLGLETLRDYVRRNKTVIPLLALVSDGRANVALNSEDPVEDAKLVAQEIGLSGIKSIAIDTEHDFLTFGLVKQISEAMHGYYLRIEELNAAPIVSAVRNNLLSDSVAWQN
jgi:magnesium chelatase subunit D